MMLWDDDYFYFDADMEEPHVWASRFSRRLKLLLNRGLKRRIQYSPLEERFDVAQTVIDPELLMMWRILAAAAEESIFGPPVQCGFMHS